MRPIRSQWRWPRRPTRRSKDRRTVAAVFSRQVMTEPSRREPLRLRRWATAKRRGFIDSLVSETWPALARLRLAAPPAVPGFGTTAVGAEAAWLTAETQLPA